MDRNNPYRDSDDPATSPGSCDLLIGFNVTIPDQEPFQMFYPRDNWYGSLLLIRSIERAFRESSIPVSKFSLNGPLNYCTGVLDVPLALRAKALQGLKSFFEEIRLLPNAAICWFDTSEEVWRAFHSQPFGTPAEVHFETQTLAKLRAISIERSDKFIAALNAKFPPLGS